MQNQRVENKCTASNYEFKWEYIVSRLVRKWDQNVLKKQTCA